MNDAKNGAGEDNHGQSLASWVTVILIIIAVLIGTLAVVLGQWPWFWGAVGLVVAALIIGKVLSMMGRRAESSPEHK